MFRDSGYRRVMAMLPIAVAGRGAPPIVRGVVVGLWLRWARYFL